MTSAKAEKFDFIVIANRLPVDKVHTEDNTIEWKRSPGGLVTALMPVMQQNKGAWIGWDGDADEKLKPFDQEDMYLVPVPLTSEEVELYYEGFSNGTLWPLYHDVIVPPEFHRTWYDAYKEVNQRFADEAVKIADEGATIWVHDYQLQLVPQMIRKQRPDVKIGFFNHIPFPPIELFSQLPWRKQITEGVLGADVVGFQRPSDARNFISAIDKYTEASHADEHTLKVKTGDGNQHECYVKAFPISIDATRITQLANDPKIIAAAAKIRHDLGNPNTIFFGVDRLDYTKGIRHRLKAFSECLNDGSLSVEDVTLIQVASPSREHVDSYIQLRSEIEETVGRLNGKFSTVSKTAVHYIHRNVPLEEMVALYLATDVMLVTSLRDGMNLVAKEYVATRQSESGVLILSEFTGAADELKDAVMINPHDITEMKNKMVKAAEMPAAEQQERMHNLRKYISENTVHDWAESFLSTLKRH
ncbi:MAG: trehalose-6-phosphate synthase [Micrococcaceae bacterium]